MRFLVVKEFYHTLIDYKHTAMYVYNMGRKPKDDRKAYLYIADYLRRYDKQPSFQEIANEMEYGSKRSVQLLLQRLMDAKMITYDDRVIELVNKSTPVVNERTVDVPILAHVPCGPLEEAIEDVQGSVKVSTDVARPGGIYFILRARGNSMNLAGIKPGDLMLVRQQATADDNDIVVALVDGAATVKRFRRDGSFVVLSPESDDPKNRPMIFSENLAIQGKVITRLPNPY